MDTISAALIGGLVGGALAAVITALVALVDARRQREHERSMARETRLQDRRAVAYERILTYAYRLSTWVDRTEPIVGPAPSPPEMIDDEAMFGLNAVTGAHASPEVQACVLDLSNAARAFQSAVWLLGVERTGGGTGAIKAWEKVEAARITFREAMTALADQAGSELRGG